MKIQSKKISKTFGQFRALESVDLEIQSGELLALLGPSGSGKTTLLRIIAGLEVPDERSGGVFFGDEDVTYKSARDRGVGFVFQHYALFRHMTVFENIAFGLNIRPAATRPPKAEIRARVQRLLKLVQLDGLEKRLPNQLSGGQRQRVALARALAVEPKVLLLDEPFGALDAKVRKELRRWLRQLHEELHITSIFVTHDQEEALELADRVVIMSNGRIEQTGTPEEVYEAPANPFVFNFLGSVNTFTSRVHEGRAHIGTLEFDTQNRDLSEPHAVAFVRPHELQIHRTKPIDSYFEAELIHIQPVGSTVRLELARRDNRDFLEVEITRDLHRSLALKTGETVYVTAQRMHIFPPDFSI
ncbi:MAG: sulfate ABC transporter ATP-binding protein [Candidatus Methylacidiphilales bacterium]|nr:sulfate ABC transporter ATP-binding protein [Candidatus Methylacidiphilales bacterium]